MIRNAQTGKLDVSNKLALLAATLDYRVISDALAVSATARAAKLADLRKHLAKGETALIAHEVDAYLHKNGLIAERGTPGWISIARAMMRAEIDALERTIERDGGDYTGTPRDPIVKPASGTAREVAKPGEGIMDIFEIFASENPRGVATGQGQPVPPRYRDLRRYGRTRVPDSEDRQGRRSGLEAAPGQVSGQGDRNEGL